MPGRVFKRGDIYVAGDPKLFHTVKMRIGMAKTTGWLIDQSENIKGSTLYTNEQKEELQSLISKKVDMLTAA